jgi:hypothetical protein
MWSNIFSGEYVVLIAARRRMDHWSEASLHREGRELMSNGSSGIDGRPGPSLIVPATPLWRRILGPIKAWAQARRKY